MKNFDETTQKNLDQWLKGPYDEKTKEQINMLIDSQPEVITDSFYTRMAFGTGGLRGIMGVGSNRMNKYTIGAATQGLANYILKQKRDDKSVLIGHDSRINSSEFAQVTAKIFAANGIKVYLFSQLRPVPLVSFGCRYKGCISAVMITASHNPPEYNGYKVYWDDGAQVVPPQDEGIIKEVYAIESPDQVKSVDSIDHPLIEWVSDEIDHAYLSEVKKLQLYPLDNKEKGAALKVVYTPIHGAGVTMVPKILEQWGFSSVSLVDKQSKPDGNFPTVEKPNPEEKQALKLGIDQMLEEGADILLGTDPDSDRIGAAINHQCKAALLSGNETACICLHHICEALASQSQMPKDGAFVKTIVTSELFKAIAESYNKPCFNVLTGFKYIGQLIKEWEEKAPSYKYLFGGEESYGYLLGTHSRDKDAVIMSALICEVALQAKLQNKTLLDFLYEIYQKHGIFREKLTSIVFKDSKENKDKMKTLMEDLRTSPPKEFNGVSIKSLEDYQSSKITHFSDNTTEEINLPKSNVLLFWLEDDTKLVIRPSGTEPKIKIYCGVVDKEEEDLDIGIKQCDKKIDDFVHALEKILK